MGLFSGLFGKKQEQKVEMVEAPAKGRCIPITEVKDPTFGAGILGQGIAVLPEEGIFYAPADGKITMAFETGHAVSMTTEEGAELLLHIGIDTVELKGKYFEMQVSSGQQVRTGDVLVKADLEAIQREGYDTAAMLVVCNTDDYAEIECITDREVKLGEAVMRLHGKR